MHKIKIHVDRYLIKRVQAKHQHRSFDLQAGCPDGSVNDRNSRRVATRGIAFETCALEESIRRIGRGADRQLRIKRSVVNIDLVKVVHKVRFRIEVKQSTALTHFHSFMAGGATVADTLRR